MSEKKLHEEGCDCGSEDEEEVNLVELKDDEGKIHKCYHIGTIEYKERWFAFFQPADEESEDEGGGDVATLEIR